MKHPFLNRRAMNIRQESGRLACPPQISGVSPRRRRMRSIVRFRVVAVFVCLGWAAAVQAQSTPSGGSLVTAVPRLMWFAGSFQPADGSPTAPVETVVLSVYHDEKGGEPIWQEMQHVVVGTDGRFNLLLGSSKSEGLPADLFTSGEPRWLGVQFSRPGEHEQPRLQLASVPYAMKAIDADTLGGKPASAYALADPVLAAGVASEASGAVGEHVSKGSTERTNPGSSTSVAGNFDSVNVVFADTSGGLTGYSVRNT